MSIINYITKDKYLLVISIAAFILLFSRYLWGYPGYLSFFFDDFYYYLKTAENFSLNFKSSFNNIQITNGYHPLYFLVLFVFCLLFKTNIVFLLVSMLSFLSVIVTYKLSRRIFEITLQERESVIFPTISVSLIFMFLAKDPMEIILTIPILLYFIYLLISKQTFDKKYSIWSGLIFSLIILSRLDASLFLILIILGFLLFKKKLDFKINYFYFILGLIPLVLYLLSNIYYFDLLFPISGLAKQMKTNLYPSILTFNSILWISPSRFIYVLTPILLNLFAIIIILFTYKNYNQKYRIILFSSVFFPPIFILYYSMVSGWMFWHWYFYMFIPAVISFFILTGNKLSFIYKNKLFNSVFVISIIFYCIIFSVFREPNDNDLYLAALKIAEFEKNHKGIYAMGDRAGYVGFLIKSPLIQTEGLMMNKQYLNDLKMLNLNDLLHKYNVDYYIATNITKTTKGWFCEEPRNYSGSTITSKSYFKENPIDSVILKNCKNYIFKMK